MSRVFQGCRVLMAAAKSGTKSTAASSTEKPKNIGLMKPLPVSPALKKFVGAAEVSRAEAVKKIWEHIKSNNLQNPANKREIRCDEKLKSIFEGKDTVGMMEIARLLKPHFL
ncbi:uncharacterized protein A4U43_C08F630 [Asparagus officinalis]|uniref:upstream activation factor subunit spp27 n=1 Tax=Asparagus officinalis TaxID=4686 RepID=UPI00098E23EF|nr:upstream activation factor subunit spp27 [Asparagus officinalis]ONK58875.1 uncharacterized protein A4U43_C08F630 [Asparagus officinalis]